LLPLTAIRCFYRTNCMHVIAGIIIFLITVLGTEQAATGIGVDCLIDKYNDYADAQQRFQNETHNLILLFNQGYSEVSELYRDDQLARIERNRLAARYLLAHKIDAVHFKKSMNIWLDLTEDDRTLIASHSEGFKELERKIEKFRSRPPHPDGDGLREMMRNKIVMSEEFIRLTKELQHRMNKINAVTCKQ